MRLGKSERALKLFSPPLEIHPQKIIFSSWEWREAKAEGKINLKS
jgi:hypothetical protein